MDAAGGVGLGRADVAADQLGRDQQLGPALDRLALQGVVGVAGPDPVGAVKDPQVDPAPPEAQLSISTPGWRAQLVQQPVGGQGLGVDPGPAGVAGLDQVAVVVPLEEGDVVLAEQRVQPVADEGVAVGVGQVEHLLVARLGSRPARPARTGPSRVGPEQVGVGVDHLRLDPQPELHAQRTDVDQRVEPSGQTSATYQSPRPAVSLRRLPNQPSSSTNRSTPRRAATSARSVSRSRRWSK